MKYIRVILMIPVQEPGRSIISKNKKDGKNVYSGTLENLNIGTYWVRETKAPDGFEKRSCNI